MRTAHRLILATAALAASVALFPALSSAQIVYSDGLTSTDGSGYNVNLGEWTSGGGVAVGAAGSSDATFGYDYSTVGVPLDPNFAGNTNTTALRIRAALNSTSYAGISVSPTGFALPNSGGSFKPFKIQYDEWTNFVSTGNNSTTLATAGIGANGTDAQWIFQNNGTVMFANTIDGGTSTSDYRAYANNNNGVTSPATYSIYGAYSVAGNNSSAILNNTYSGGTPPVAYYENALTGGGTINAPAGETGNTPSTTAGTTSYAWHVVDVSFTGTDYIWSIDGTVMADIPSSLVTTPFNGTNFFIGGSDTSSTGDTTALAQQYNFILVDNLSVTAVPEPASLSLLGIGAIGLLARRRRNLA